MLGKKANIQAIVIIIVVGLIIISTGVYTFFLSGNIGVELNCDTKSIEGFGIVPPPLMTAYQPTICIVDMQVMYNNEVICEVIDIKISNTPRGVIACNKLKELDGKKVNIIAEFSDRNYNSIGRDEEELVFRGV